MRFLIFTVLFMMSGVISAQHSLIFDLPCDKGTLKNNNVGIIHVTEIIDSLLRITQYYEIDEEGNATKHYQYYPNTTVGVVGVVEECRISKDTAGFVDYKRYYKSHSNEKTLTHHYQHYYSKTNKGLKFIHLEYGDYTTVRTTIFDTIHTYYENKTEIRILSSGDTLFMTKDLFDGTERVHEMKRKSNGKWIEHEIGVTVFNNGVYESYTLYKNGKLVQEHRAADEIIKKGNDEYDDFEYGLPIPDPVTDTFYVNDFKNEKLETVKQSKAKYKVLVHYEQGRGSDQFHYEVFDMKFGWLIARFGQGKSFYIEYTYIIRE